jgi:hypothetical protein
MSRWTCPKCDREFGRARQAHTCVPGCTVEACFAPWPPVYREIYDPVSGDRTVHIVKLLDPADVDAQLRAWLTEAFDAASD